MEAARAVSELTHYDPEAGDACVLWSCAIRHAILTGLLDARIGLQYIDSDRRDLWTTRLEVAEVSQPSDFKNNGWVVEALQAAWSAITTTPIPGTIRPQVSSALTTFGSPLTQQCGAAETPTQSRPLQADCLARHTGHQRSLQTGVECCTAGPGCQPATWSHWQ